MNHKQSDNPVDTGTNTNANFQPSASTESSVPPIMPTTLPPITNKAKKKPWIWIVVGALVVFGIIGAMVPEKPDQPVTEEDADTGLKAVESYMTEQNMHPRIARYCFGTNGGNVATIFVSDSLKNAITGQWLGYKYYGAELEFSGGFLKDAKVRRFQEIPFPGEDHVWKVTSLGKQEGDEAADQFFKR